LIFRVTHDDFFLLRPIPNPRIKIRRQRNTARMMKRKVRRLRPRYLRWAGRARSKRSISVGLGLETGFDAITGIMDSAFVESEGGGTGFLEKKP
jgi:hypothetical protein